MADEKFLFPRTSIHGVLQKPAQSHFKIRHGNACRMAAPSDENEGHHSQHTQQYERPHLDGNIEEIPCKGCEILRRGNRPAPQGEAEQIACGYQQDRQHEGQLDAAVKIKFHKEADIAEHGRNIQAADHGNRDGAGQADSAVADDSSVSQGRVYRLLSPPIQQEEHSRCRRRDSTADSHELQEQGAMKQSRSPGSADDCQRQENIIYLFR